MPCLAFLARINLESLEIVQYVMGQPLISPLKPSFIYLIREYSPRFRRIVQLSCTMALERVMNICEALMSFIVDNGC